VANLVKVTHQILLWQEVIFVDVAVLCKVIISFGRDFSRVMKHPLRLLLLVKQHIHLLGGLTRRLLVGSYWLFVLVEAFNSGLSWLLLHFTFQSWVEVILNVVVCAPIEELGYFWPAVAIFLVQIQYFLVLFLSPPILFDVGIQMVVPPLTTLFSDAAIKTLGNLTPVSGTLQFDLFN
jgi:hypothetical protein